MNFKQSKILIILISGIFILILSSCSVTRKLKDDEFYLNSNKYRFEGEKAFKKDLEGYVTQKPNSKVFGFLPFQDWMYNFVPKKFDSSFEEYYSYTRDERNQQLLDSIYIKNGLNKYVGKNEFLYRQFYKWGTEPVILDSTLSYSSAKNLEEMYFSRGYFDAKVSPIFKIDSSAQKATVTYNIDIKEPSYIKNYNQAIVNTDMERLYNESVEDSEVKIGQRFDVRNFEAERDRITRIFRNNGYYRFDELGDELIFKVDSTDSKQLGVTMRIAKPKNDSIKNFIKYKFGKIEIFPNNVNNDIAFTENYKGYAIKSDKKIKFKPQVFTNAITIKEGDIYSDKTIDETRTLIFDRENFFLTSIVPEENVQDSLINLKIFLQPKPKYDLELTFEAMYSQFLNFGVSPGLRLLTRNIFKGGENLEFNLRGTVGTVNKAGAEEQFFNAYELGFNTELSFPRWVLIPHVSEFLPKKYNLKSAVGLGLSRQKSIGLGGRNYLAYLNYKFQPGLSNITIEPLNFQYIKNEDKDKYYRIFTLDNQLKEETYDSFFKYSPYIADLYKNGEINEQELDQLIYQDDEFAKNLPSVGGNYNFEDYTDFRNMIFRKKSITQDVFIQPIGVSLHYNENKKINKKNPWNIYAGASVSGALLRLADAVFNFEKQENFLGEKVSLIGGVPYSEYFRFDLDVRKTFNLPNKNAIALRGLFGIAIPYGNSTTIPFSKSYFGGGSNDVRAWKAYELSPSPLRPNDSGTYIDDMKLTFNAEYRFPLSGILHGATFIDAGNIWSVKDDNSRTQFKFNRFYKQLGVGGGFGLRFDFTFVIARLDFAYKLHDPAYEEGNRWVRDFNFLKPRIQFGINYPF
ncbi:outer membrane protein assembly factor [Weeksellaceae bacterium TAE3-ERU29]|nr:outer membrane protein assembly factor [Weeksellaceae bacterium TAE3-ERU29]